MKSLWDSVLWLRRKNKQDKEEILTAVNAVQNLFKTSGEATASASDIVAPKTAYNGTTLITGTIADKTGTSEYAATASIDNTNKKIKMQVPADGKYGTKNYLYQSFSNIASLIGLTASKLVKNNTVLGITGNSSNMDTSGCDAAAAQILSGKKAGVKGNVVTGTMVNRAGTTVQAAAVTQDDDNTYFAVPEAAYYDKNSKIATANSNLSGKSLKIVHFETGGSGNYKTANIIFDVSNFSTLHFDGTGGIGSGGFAVLGGSGVNIPYGTRQCSLTNSVTLESIGDGGSSKKEYDISKYSYIRLYMRGTPEGYDYIKYFSNISFS